MQRNSNYIGMTTNTTNLIEIKFKVTDVDAEGTQQVFEI